MRSGSAANCDHYFVAIEETRVHLVALGVPASEVTVSGIPIDPVFAEPKDPRAMRRKHGLDEDAFTILVSAGGFGVGPVRAHHPGALEAPPPGAGRRRSAAATRS